ncbi:TonB-dependent receptor plug domain-containing protein [uncultured Sphingomonas sp.]|uniref:TonB-dependent receptor plug domain-containing protein n=1 Tax=uncultured Sphingomonas sp. TaxID=158754 RepID=UPI0025DC0001|nr:TonB-dependent receptor plug domain-containing protein [uncultured Sphingomonas sp.]
MIRIHLLAGAAAPCLLLAMPAAAQTQNTSSTNSDVTTSQSWTGDIIVTGARETYTAPETSAATRTDTPLIQVPQSVQVLTRTLIQEQDRRTLGDALVNVSGVTPTRVDEVLFIPPIVRGFPAEVYLDGLSVFAGNQQAYDPNSLVGIERIDVLKGPTATLYGVASAHRWAGSSTSKASAPTIRLAAIWRCAPAASRPGTLTATSTCRSATGSRRGSRASIRATLAGSTR